jgi:hypothetical protein
MTRVGKAPNLVLVEPDTGCIRHVIADFLLVIRVLDVIDVGMPIAGTVLTGTHLSHKHPVYTVPFRQTLGKEIAFIDCWVGEEGA